MIGDSTINVSKIYYPRYMPPSFTLTLDPFWGTLEDYELVIEYDNNSSYQRTYNNLEEEMVIDDFFDSIPWVGLNRELTILLSPINSEGLETGLVTTVYEIKAPLLTSLQYVANKLSSALSNNKLLMEDNIGLTSLISMVPRWEALKIVNDDNYSHFPTNKIATISNELIRNTANSCVSMNTEFVPPHKKSYDYDLSFTYHTSVGDRNGFMYGFDPDRVEGSNINEGNDSYGIAVKTDNGNTMVQQHYNNNSSTLYTHTSNLLTSGQHNILIKRRGDEAEIYIDDVLLYTHDNVKYDTLGLDKWSTGYNSIDGISIEYLTMNLESYLFDIDDYYTANVDGDTFGAGSTSSMSVTENNELLISDYQTRAWHNTSFTNNTHYVIEMELKKPVGIYVGADFEVMIGEPSKYVKFDTGYYGEYIHYLTEENGTQQEVVYSTTGDRFADYFTLRITRDGTHWKCEWIVNGTTLRTLEATTQLNIPNKLGFTSYSWANRSDQLYVRNIKLTES